METLRDVLIAADEIDRYFDGRAPVTLWRSKRADPREHLFGLVEQPVVRPGGKVRPADIKIETGPDGQDWVRIRYYPRGISTFDKRAVFKGNQWEYYRIEAGTVLPEGLAIVRDGYNRVYEATHYTIAPAWDMPLNQFKALLRAFAHHLIREAA
jgi:hypothetical protein